MRFSLGFDLLHTRIQKMKNLCTNLKYGCDVCGNFQSFVSFVTKLTGVLATNFGNFPKRFGEKEFLSFIVRILKMLVGNEEKKFKGLETIHCSEKTPGC